jgi:cytoskeletal protein CcmA (bactofilin family)
MAIPKMTGDSANNIIGVDSFFSGTFIVNGSLRIDGRFEGKFLQAELLYIGSTGKIKTNISTVSLVVEGLIIGNINASGRILLMPTARVYGDVKTPELIIQNGVILEGKCTIATDLRSSAREVIEAEYEKNRIGLEEIFGSEPAKKKA